MLIQIHISRANRREMISIHLNQGEEEQQIFQKNIVKTVASHEQDTFGWASVEYFSQGRYKSKQVIFGLIFFLILTVFCIMRKGQVEEVLYPNKAMQKWRRQFNQHRVEFIDQNKQVQGLHLAKYNMILEPFESKQLHAAKEDFDVEWGRLENKFHLSSITEELPMCVVVTSFNNNANFRIEYNLNSIFTQNYSNFKVVVVNDASNDESEYVYHRYFEFYDIDPEYHVYIQNNKKKFSLQNIYLAITKHCGQDSIVVRVDGDDELIGRNVLKVLNWGYQTKKAGVLYSNFFSYYQPIEVKTGFTIQYTEEQKKSSSYRDIDMKFSHLLSFRAQFFIKINPKDLKDEFGNFYEVACDQAFFFAVMQMACGRVYKIEGEYQYLYNMATGLNVKARGDGLKEQIQERIRASKKYECSKDFDDRMKLLQ